DFNKDLTRNRRKFFSYPDGDAILQVFLPHFSALKPKEPSKEELEVFVQLRFARALEEGMQEAVSELLEEGYTGDSFLVEDAPLGRIITRDLLTEHETEVGTGQIVTSRVEAKKKLTVWIGEKLPVGERELEVIAGLVARIVRPNLDFNKDLTRNRRKEAEEAAGQIMVKIPKGQIIVRFGEEITPERQKALLAMSEDITAGQKNFLVFLGTVIPITLLVFVQWRYIREHPRFERIHRSCHVLTIIIMIISLFSAKLYYILATALQESSPGIAWIDSSMFKLGAPLAIGAMLVVLLLDTQVGYLFAILFSLLMGYLADGDAFLMFYVFIGNIAAIYGLNMSDQKQRGALWKACAVVACANILVILGNALRSTPFPSYKVLAGQAAFGLIGPLILTLPIVYMAMYLLETIFGITTDIRLLELSNTNEPLLKQLQIQAPGTFHHSLMVANLAEPAAEAVNAHPLYVRVASLYHDVGKINKPEYFIENQDPGANPHEKLASSMSSLILVSHVKDGLDLARAYKLPPGIRDVIRQHHGTKLIKYFFEKAKDNVNPDLGNVNESDYRYPGPKPQTRESAIIMLADAIEAASRTLTDPSPAKLKGMVRKIVENIFSDQQLDECDLTLRDLEKISNAFLRVLAALHHQRIDYPGFRFEGQDDFKKSKSPASSSGKVLEWKQNDRNRSLE
ncbi:HD family phosphohydrolase, partial [Acidobacteriota bacterium]